jgi:hypothetical protein
MLAKMLAFFSIVELLSRGMRITNELAYRGRVVMPAT